MPLIEGSFNQKLHLQRNSNVAEVQLFPGKSSGSAAGSGDGKLGLLGCSAVICSYGDCRIFLLRKECLCK